MRMGISVFVLCAAVGYAACSRTGNRVFDNPVDPNVQTGVEDPETPAGSGFEAVTLFRTLSGHTKGVNGVAINADGSTIVSGSSGDGVRIWRTSDGALLRTLTPAFKEYAVAVALSNDGQVAVSGTYNQFAMWRMPDGELLRTVSGGAGVPDEIAFSPDGQTFAVVWESWIAIRRVSDGALVHNLSLGIASSSYVKSVAYSPNGQAIVAGYTDRYVRVWDLSSWGVREIPTDGNGRHTDWIEAVAVTPDGQKVISGSADHSIKVWRLSDGAILRTLTGHSSIVESVTVTPDGQYIVSCSRDKTIKIWRLSDYKLVKTLSGVSGHIDYVNSVAISHDGRYIVSGSSDRTVKIWLVP